MIFLVYCIISLFYDVIMLPQPCVIYFVLPWHDIAYLCWKCR